MKYETPHQQVGRALHEGWGRSGAFAGSILSGTLLGFFADRWLGTEPWLVVIGSLLGIYSGFVQVWNYTKTIGEGDRES
jgi:F0F1-type ATP synthase assembly protein I